MLAVTLQTDTLHTIQNIVKGLRDHGDNAERADTDCSASVPGQCISSNKRSILRWETDQMNSEIPKEEQWPAVVLVLTSLQQRTGGSLPSKTPELSGSDPLKSFIGITVRQILLEPKLDQYSRGDSKTKKGPNPKTPYTLVKVSVPSEMGFMPSITSLTDWLINVHTGGA
ncbi:hypothetical protein Pst134EA_029348 [Puccinia striiformis f. sp. tritici]|uniref:hypothetical protein n=1 Tax=Puccinia striiformis f. sp. tritici TaxID=168172 RepID=UPI002007E92F|nr:hypothetical protein Pst134EA_029348 [Puccinia striiformis f. sp. tritici]KAH9447314.1 hypothetical protein Pst134EA_029348 [Puccinia striiformis f. sp. tritici]